jgi:predicted NAD/FAD-binding protein
MSSASWRPCADARDSATPARAVRRDRWAGVRDAGGQWDRFDKACSPAMPTRRWRLLTTPTPRARLLGRFAYSLNEVWLHATSL